MENLEGKKFGRLEPIKYLGQTKSGHHSWLCQCECGRQKSVLANNLKGGYTQSCGCFQKERAAATQIRHGGHRRSGAWPEYGVWCAMLTRCYNQKSRSYPYYGARGISVCERWHDFGNFISDMGRRPSPRLTIDRMDNDGNYEPANCRWATKGQQMRNRRPLPFENLSGRRFGKLLLLSGAGRTEKNELQWECLCDCGANVIVRGRNLRGGNTKSCGCLQKEIARKLCIQRSRT
jgi:hypothetical protein